MLVPKTLIAKLRASPVAMRLARGSVWSLAGSASSRILVLFAMTLAARILGREAFGELGMVQATLVMFGILAGAGLGQTGTRFVAQHAKNDPAEAARIIGLVQGSAFVLVSLVVALFILFSATLAREVLEAPHLQRALMAASLVMAVNVFRGIQNGIIAGFERFDISARLNVLEGLLTLAFIILLAPAFGVLGVLLGLTMSGLFVWVVGQGVLGGICKSQQVMVRYSDMRKRWRILANYSFPSLLANAVATPALWLVMTWVARGPDGYAQLGLYQAAYQWHAPLMFLPMILANVSLPVLVQAWESGEIHRYRKIFLTSSGFALGITLVIAIPASVASPWILSFYGKQFVEGWPLFVLLMLATPFHAVAKIASGALFGMNKPWWVFYANLAWSLALIAGSWLMVDPMGALGLSIAFCSAYFLLGSLTAGMVWFHAKAPCRDKQGFSSNMTSETTVA